MRTASNVHFAPGDMAAAAIIALLLVAASWTAAIGGPVTDFEKALAAAYAPYRAALMQTNQKDKAATELSLKSFDAKWSELMKTYKSAPPPQYADDPKWPATIGAIERILVTARGEAAKGDLGKAHDVLEGIREELGHLRVRNGVITFSDRMDLYHEKMEQVLTGKYSDLNANGIGMLREDSAVLAHLVQQASK